MEWVSALPFLPIFLFFLFSCRLLLDGTAELGKTNFPYHAQKGGEGGGRGDTPWHGFPGQIL